MSRRLIIVPMALACMICMPGCKKAPPSEPAQDKAAAVQQAPAEPQGKLTTVTITSISPGSVELALPVHSNNQRIKFSELKNVKGSWEQTYGGDRIVSHEKGSEFTVDIISDKAEIPFLSNTDGADVTLTYDGKVKNISLKGDVYDWRPEKID